MSTMVVCDDYIAVAKGLHIDYYDYSSTNHTTIDVPQSSKPQEKDAIHDMTLSDNSQHLAIITSISKQLIVYNVPNFEKFTTFLLPRSASKIRFTANDEQILVADKSGDVLIYSMKDDDKGTKLLGHLSLLLDVLQTNDGKFIISSDRDEKIRVSCYPNTYNIQTFCLGHKEFVNHIELLPNNDKYLTSTSGDGFVKCWNYMLGKLCYSIDTFKDVNDEQLKEDFSNAMDSEGVEVYTLPIVHYSVTKLNDTSNILAVVVHSYNKLLLYQLNIMDNEFSHSLLHKLSLDKFPTAIKFHNLNLFLYDDINCEVSVFKILNEKEKIESSLDKKICMFKNKIFNVAKENGHDSIKVLYKRKFDNVQEYQERKRQRLEKTIQ